MIFRKRFEYSLLLYFRNKESIWSGMLAEYSDKHLYTNVSFRSGSKRSERDKNVLMANSERKQHGLLDRV